MKKFKVLLFSIPLITSIILEIVAKIFLNYGYALRSKPSEFLFWFFILSIVFFAFGILLALYKWHKRKNSKKSKTVFTLSSILITVSSIALLAFSLFADAFSYQPEHIVTKDNEKMVAEVNSFTDVFVYYYEYKGKIFRGDTVILEEWYGSGGYDPFNTEMDVSPKRTTKY